MAKKRINIVLLLLVLGLWGTVAYKTISQYFFAKVNTIKDDGFTGEINLETIKKDTFVFETIDRDPFLKKQYSKPDTILLKSRIIKPVIIPKKVEVKPKPVTIWPLVDYYGYIKSKEKVQELILVKIDNRLHKLRKADEVDGLFINKVYNDSIEVTFNKEKRVIKIK
jgi:hypothetical protein